MYLTLVAVWFVPTFQLFHQILILLRQWPLQRTLRRFVSAHHFLFQKINPLGSSPELISTYLDVY